MPKPESALASALSLLLLCSCASQEPTSVQNDSAADAAEANALGDAGLSAPEAPGTQANGAADAVPPPDAVSHPNGYLPPAPGEGSSTTGNSSGPEESPPATEDEYMRNRQAAR